MEKAVSGPTEKVRDSGKRIIRVFPRRTKATPDDDMAAVNRLPHSWDEADEVHVSVAFTWDIPRAERLAKQWETVAPVQIGGPAMNTRGEEFVPGVYIKPGYVITSRGCPNRCAFCSVWRREGGQVWELPIRDGWNILDDNLLACSEDHIRTVFAMLARQKHSVDFSGGLEAARLKDWHVNLLAILRPHQMFFAYDSPNDYESLVWAGKMLLPVFGRQAHQLRAYVLIGYQNDSIDAAEKRLRACYAAGFLPMAMLYRDEQGRTNHEWRRFQRAWARAASVNRICSKGCDWQDLLDAIDHKHREIAGQRSLFE